MAPKRTKKPPTEKPSLVSAAGGKLQCQWQGCNKRSKTPEALYKHVCEDHVGRQSTNSLNLTCAWGQCHYTKEKRDHVTSHVRTHIPDLRPSKCKTCGKAFRRSQDLRKHAKTHKNDSVTKQSPKPSGRRAGGARQ